MKNIFIVLVSLFSIISVITIRGYLLKKRKYEINMALNANYFLVTLNNLIEENKYNLLEERTRLKVTDPYGNEEYEKWIGNPPLDKTLIEISLNNGSKRFKEGIPYFWEKVILKKFSGLDSFFEKWYSYRKINPIINDEIIGSNRRLQSQDWYIFIASQIEKSCLKTIGDNTLIKRNQNYKKGIVFEKHCMEILEQSGWKVKETPKTGDQGVDLIASIANFRICIQCKNHGKVIGNKAVQEISAGKLYWKGTHAVLVSKSGFTKSAKKLAIANKVKLVNDFELKDLGNILI